MTKKINKVKAIANSFIRDPNWSFSIEEPIHEVPEHGQDAIDTAERVWTGRKVSRGPAQGEKRRDKPAQEDAA